ncbi:unnamed protein product [Brassica rapa subsp. trilocularis]
MADIAILVVEEYERRVRQTADILGRRRWNLIGGKIFRRR